MRISDLGSAALAAEKMRQVPVIPRLAGLGQLACVVAAERLPVIVQRVHHHPPGDHLDLAAPAQLGPCLPVYVLLSDGQAAVRHLRSSLPGAWC